MHIFFDTMENNGMQLFRTIHSIGQGAFYTEKFVCDKEEINIVYDCGSFNSRTLKKEISQTFEKDENIFAIFISHFHSDHMNCLETLLQRCNVQYLFLPMLSNEAKLLLYIAYLKDDKMRNWVFNTRATLNKFSRKTKIVFIKISNEKNNIKNDPIDMHEIGHGGELSSGQPLHIRKEIDWEYIPHNIENEDLRTRIIDTCKDYRITPEEIFYNDREIKYKIEILEKIYKKVLNSSSDLNTNSMTLYSGPSPYRKLEYKIHVGHNSFYKHYRHKYYYNDYLHWNDFYFIRGNIGCLYLGDFNLKNNGLSSLNKNYSRYKDQILMIQIPHHGALSNFDINITDVFYKTLIYFVSYGENNTYRHPSTIVLKKIVVKNKYLAAVTEKKQSEFYIYCEF